MKMRDMALSFPTLLVVTFLGAAALLTVYSASAQSSPTGSIEGMLTDSTGAAIPGMRVTATGQGGGGSSTTTNEEGFFRFANLKPGNYTLTVEAEKGFGKFELPNVAVNLSRTTNVPVQLRSAGAAESVEVTSSPGASVDVTKNKTGGTANVKTNGGLTTITFATNPGDIRVYLPDDMRAGETISGTAIADPKGSSEAERKNNAAKLSEFKLIFGSQFPKELKDLMILITPRIIIQDDPAPSGSGDFTTKLPETFNYTIGGNAPQADTQTVTITINSRIWFINNSPTPPPATSPFSLPTMGQQGRPLEIFGPFDGNSSNTRLMYGPQRSTVPDFKRNTENVSGGFGLIRPLAESPRKIVFESPANVVGPVQLHVQEGLAQAIAAYRSVAVHLKGKTNLIKGEKTSLTTEVSGLQGITKPVPLTLEAKGVVTMDGGMFQQLFIQPSQVGADGLYVTSRVVTGVQAGGWEATSTVVTTPFNIVLRDPNPPKTLLVNSFTGDYVFCGQGPKLTGTGKIQMKGCIITLRHDAPDRRVFANLNACVPADNGRFFPFYSPGTTADLNVTVTDTRPSRTRLYVNPLGKPAPPVQDTSAFATCP